MKNEFQKTFGIEENRLASDNSPVRRPGPCFNILSILVIPIGLLIAFLFLTKNTSGWGWENLFWGCIVMAISILTGIILGIIALIRNERLKGLTIIALLIHSGPIFFFLFATPHHG